MKFVRVRMEMAVCGDCYNAIRDGVRVAPITDAEDRCAYPVVSLDTGAKLGVDDFCLLCSKGKLEGPDGGNIPAHPTVQ